MGCKRGSHGCERTAAGRQPSFRSRNSVDSQILKLDLAQVAVGNVAQVGSVEDGDALRMARMLSEQLGLGVGVSSGANFVGGVMAQNALGGDTVVVTAGIPIGQSGSTNLIKAQVVGEPV